MALAVDSFSFANLAGDSTGLPVSATLYLNNPADIFVAQIALTSVVGSGSFACGAYIYGITLSNGEHLEFHTPLPCAIEWADTQSVTFVLSSTAQSSSYGSASALASVTTYSET
jgi:hypothetical protein